MYKFNEKTTVYSTKTVQKSMNGHEVALILHKEFPHLPRLRRSPNSGVWQPTFLCITPNGFQDGNYSTVDIFIYGSGKDSWYPEIEIEGWYSYDTIDKMVFTQTNGTTIEVNHSDDLPPKRNGNYPDKTFKIDPKNPIIQIDIY